VVVATGGLESARLLLASRDVHPHGIGNHHDVLGRYYQAHLAGTIGTVIFDKGRTRIWHGYDRDAQGVYVRRRLALNEAAQRQHRLGNVIARLHHPRIADPAHGTAVLSALYLGQGLVPRLYRKRLAGEDIGGIGNWLRHIGNVARNPLACAGFAATMLIGRKFAKRKFPSVIVTPRTGRYSIDFHAEQVPNPASRVYLVTDRDALGMPRLVADWQYLPQDVATLQGAFALLAQDLAASGLGHFDYDPDTVEAEMIRYGAYPGHHIGTVRMGDDPASSMVDADCRIHGVGGLSVAGTSVFPTSSQANPTLTAIALGLRLADHLARGIKGNDAGSGAGRRRLCRRAHRAGPYGQRARDAGDRPAPRAGRCAGTGLRCARPCGPARGIGRGGWRGELRHRRGGYDPARGTGSGATGRGPAHRASQLDGGLWFGHGAGG
jgi:choline dehydrogenase-like flavoprotein